MFSKRSSSLKPLQTTDHLTFRCLGILCLYTSYYAFSNYLQFRNTKSLAISCWLLKIESAVQLILGVHLLWGCNFADGSEPATLQVRFFLFFFSKDSFFSKNE